jgi:DNA polymerase III subunit delta'
VPFRTIVGHRRLLELLSRSLAAATLPSSLIFAGPDGVGKRRTAVALAQALNCLAPVVAPQAAEQSGADRRQAPAAARGDGTGVRLPVDACGECAVCRRIARSAFTDVIVVESGDTGSIKIEQVRAVVAETAFKPFEGRRRVVIIDEAEAMGFDAQDALLKSLEEPPPLSVFVLVSSRADTLAATVRSRCSRLRFGRLSAAEISRVLERDHGLAEDRARKIAALAGGSLGRALDVASGDLDDVRTALCRTLRDVAEAGDDRARLGSAKDLAGGRRTGSSPAVGREDLATRLVALGSLLRDLAVLSTRAQGSALANLDLTSELEGLTRFYGRDRTLRAFAAADRALAALRGNASPKIVADWLVLQL